MYRTLCEANKKMFPNFFEEIRGFADGSGFPLEDILMLNFFEISILNIKSQIEKSCTDILINNSTEFLIGHNEDIPVKNSAEYAWMADIEISGIPKFSAYIYPGMIAGNAFSWNEHGVVMTINYLNPVYFDPEGASVAFICRHLVEAKSISDLISRIPPRNAAAVSLNVASIHENRMVNIEIHGTEFSVKEIIGEYSHVNSFKRIGAKEFTRLRSSEMRQAKLNSFPVFTGNVKTILGNTENEFPIYRTIIGVDLAETSATAIFDLRGKTVEIYVENPSTSSSHYKFNLL